MPEFRFNRRRVVDQTVFVIADNAEDALRKARAGDVHETGDEENVSITVRRIR